PVEPKTEAAKQAKSLWRGETLDWNEAQPAQQFVDCLFGTGLTREIGDEWFDPFLRLFAGAKKRLAIDLPSGIESDHGILLNAVPAFDTTIALGAFKPSHLLEPARSLMGNLVGVEIGIDAESKCAFVQKPKLYAPSSQDHKYSRGLVAVVAGEMAGAAHLAAMAAQKSGAGYVKIYAPTGFQTPRSSIVVEKFNDVGELQQKLSDSRIAALVIGPGMGRDARALSLLAAALAVETSLVIDADALTVAGSNLAAMLQARSAQTVATPHHGEFAHIFPRGNGQKLDDSRKLAMEADATVLLKGSDTVIADPDGQAAISSTSCPWLSTAGTGDVLAGIVASRLARGLSGYMAACEGQWLHSRAARLAGPAFTPEMLIDQLPATVQECL
ncbi:MAG: NAD(P)H-hydrate dehydratase, partial [Sphingorhabdus sp.]